MPKIDLSEGDIQFLIESLNLRPLPNTATARRVEVLKSKLLGDPKSPRDVQIPG